MFEYTSGNKTVARNFSWLVSNLPRKPRNFTLQKTVTDSPTGLTEVRYAIRCRHFKSEGSPIQAPNSKNVIADRKYLLQKVK